MTSIDPYLEEVYPEAPLVTYSKPKNIREYFIRAKLAPNNRPYESRQLNGMKKGNKSGLFALTF